MSPETSAMTGPVVGAVMIAEPLDAALLPRLVGPGGQAAGVTLTVEPV